MRCFLVAGRVFRQILRDRRTLALLLFVPVMAIFLLYTVLNASASTPEIIAVSLPDTLRTSLTEYANVTDNATLSDSLSLLRDRKSDAVVTCAEPDITVYVEGTQTAVTASVMKAVASAVSEYGKAYAQQEALQQMDDQKQAILTRVQDYLTLQGLSAPNAFTLPETDWSVPQPSIEYTYLYGETDTTNFDTIAPFLMGFFIYFFVFLLAGVAFLRERNTGTLERLLATPVRRYEIVLGYFLGFGVFVLLQTIIVQVYIVKGLGISLQGDFALVLLVNLVQAAGSLALGTLLSAFANNELQMFQFIPVVIVPQALFSGLFSLRGAPGWVIALSKLFPLTYAADALDEVALRGHGFGDILPDLLILFGYMVLFLTLNTLALRKYRQI
ncbi:MAG: ABC transporter permease [Eubacteriales bacterium]|nr:ABC transporter permease [Eubacteriales bacterium]